MTMPRGVISLPSDERPHPAEAIEWYFFAGHLRTTDGRRIAFHFVDFSGVFSGAGGVGAHGGALGLTDESDRTFHHVLAFASGRPEATADGYQISAPPQSATGNGNGVTLHLEVDGYTLNLRARPVKPPVFGFDHGYWDQGEGFRQYELVRHRLLVSGTLTKGGRTTTLTGTLVTTHDWTDNPQVIKYNWDWFAVQLDDGRDISIWRIRRSTSGPYQWWTATMTDRNCHLTELSPQDVTIQTTGTWTRPDGSCTYPAGWLLTVKGRRYRINPVIPNQEIDLFPAPIGYWEGDSIVTGAETGRAFVELNAYCQT